MGIQSNAIPQVMFSGSSILPANYTLTLAGGGTFQAHRLCTVPENVAALEIVTTISAIAGNAIPNFFLYQQNNSAPSTYDWVAEANATKPAGAAPLTITHLFLFQVGIPIPTALATYIANPASALNAASGGGFSLNARLTTQGATTAAIVTPLMNPGLLLAYNNGLVGNTWTSFIKVKAHFAIS